MKLLLVSLQSNAYVTGLKYVAANARAHGHDVKILYLPGYLDAYLHPEIEKFIHEFNPDLIGISLMSIEYFPAKNLTRLLKNTFDIPVIWGGVHVLIKPEECIEHADYICTGEGEHVTVLLLNHLEAEHGIPPVIPGVWFNNNGDIIKQPDAQPEMELDRLPMQEYLPEYFFGFHNNRIYNFARNEDIFRRYALYGGTCHMLISTRGCPFTCSYCGNAAFTKIYGRKVRERSVPDVICEMKEVKKNSYVLYMNFQDDCFFTHSREWIAEFCREYKKHIRLPFIVRVIPSMMDRDKMLMLKNAGLCWVVMGIQSGSDRVNYEVYDRRVMFDTVKAAAEIISESHAAPFYEMIVDNPYETEDDMITTIRAMATLKKPYICSLAHLTFFPGTPLAERAAKDGIVKPDAYLYRYLLQIDGTYVNKLLSITPHIPGAVVRWLNLPESLRKSYHTAVLHLLYVMTKRAVEPAVFLFITMRSLNYRLDWIFRTVLGNWKPTLSRLVSKYLGKSDLEFDQKLKLAKERMPELFER
ncbi:MAG: B12-binding domain-containing radical SAM protein [Nitrospiraceae bacterium]|nr:MAG: B12-binding domain-containing radical SAM protein [Nitrospiraceae bacterium]